MNTEAMIQAGMLKKNGAFGFSAAKTTSMMLPSRLRPASGAVGRSTMLTNSVGAMTMAAISRVNRMRPIISSTMWPKYQKKNIEISTQKLGTLTIGQVTRRQTSPERTRSGKKTSRLAELGLTA